MCSSGAFKAVIFTSYGPAIGLGHMMRACRLAKGLSHQLGVLVSVCVFGPQVDQVGDELVDLHFLADSSMLLDTEFLDRLLPSLVLLDLSQNAIPIDLGVFLAVARQRGIKLVAVDGLVEYKQQLDLIFLPSFLGPPLCSPSVQEAKIVFGWDCFLLDDIPRPLPWYAGPRVLALTGGSDITKLGRGWPMLLNDRLPEGTELSWVTGPFAQKPVWPRTPKIKMTQHLAPNGLQHLMSTTNYGVTVYGVSFFELLKLGVPTVVFSPYGDKDDLELEEIDRNKLAVVAKDEVDATEKLIALMRDNQFAYRLSVSAKNKLRSSGIDRLCSEVKILMSM